nr:unnamed protein product [Spirometra erinaceieuropaei]
MEKIIKKALMQFLEQHHLLRSDAQHGFRSGWSCLTNLLFTLERWPKARDEDNVVHAIYIDFKKAFDSVPHQCLLHKLRNAGVRGRLLVWIQSFLAGRSQRVQVGRQQSSEDLAIETIERLLQSKYDETDNRLGRAQVLQLLKFSLRTYIAFDGTICEEVKGTPLGSPI